MTLRTGRRRPTQTAASHPHLFPAFARYSTPLLPVTPDAVDWSITSRAAQADILGNGTLGDCTSAARSHLIECWTANAGAPVVLTAAETIEFYSASTGYVPDDPSTDQGGDEITVLTAWRDQGPRPISGWIAVDATNRMEVMQAIYMLEGLYVGGELVPAWMQNVANGAVWDVGTQDPSEGHAIAIVGYNDTGPIGNSWGFLVQFTWAAFALFAGVEHGGNCFALLSTDVLNRASLKAPSGLDWAAIEADSQAAADSA